MKKITKKGYFIFFAMLGAAFSIAVTGCKKDQAEQQTGSKDQVEQQTKQAVAKLGDAPPVVPVTSTPEPPNGSTTNGCNIQFNNDLVNPGLTPQIASGNYVKCMLVAFPDGPGSGGSSNPGIGIAHLQSVGNSANTTLRDFFRDGNMNNPADVAKVKAYFAPYIFIINKANYTSQGSSGISPTNVMLALWAKNYIDQYDQYQYLAILQAYFTGISEGMRNDPIWKGVGFDHLLMDNLINDRPELPVQP